MIEVLSRSRCIDCDICLRVCPTNVFDPGEGAPVIARQSDCQTCFQCEAYCPVAAIYVAPLREPAPAGSAYRDESALAESGELGVYRERIGWGDSAPELPTQDQLTQLLQHMRARLPAARE